MTSPDDVTPGIEDVYRLLEQIRNAAYVIVAALIFLAFRHF